MADEEHSLGKLEEAFHNVVEELLGDQQLAKFRDEYERLYKALVNSHRNEQLLVKKCKQLRSELVANAESVQKAMSMTEEDQNSILLLQKEVKKAWKQVSKASDKEQQSAAIIKKLRAELHNLQKVVSNGCGLTEGQEDTVNDLLKAKSALTKELNDQNKQRKKSHDEYVELFGEYETLKDIHAKSDAQMKEQKAKILKVREDMEMNIRRAERSEKQLGIMNQIVQEKKGDLEKKKVLLENLRGDRSDLQTNNGKLKRELCNQSNEMDRLQKKLESLEADLNREREKERLLGEKSEEQSHALSSLNEELRKTQSESADRKGLIDQVELEKQKIQQEKGDLLATMEEMRIHFDTVKSELKAFEKRSKDETKHASDLTTEIHRLGTQLSVSKKKHVKNQTVIENARDKQKELQSDVDNANLQIRDMKKLKKQLERQLLKDTQDQNKLITKSDDLKRLVQTYSSQLEQANSQILEERAKLRHQQALYEKVRGERNDFCQKSIEAQDLITKGNQNAKILAHQVQQSKEEMSIKDEAILKQHVELKNLVDVEVMLLKKISKKDEILSQCDKLLEAQDVELNALRRTISDIEKQQRKQKQVFDTVADERDILSAQCVRRNDELALLNEKIRILESTLRMGEVCYNERIEDIKTLKLKVKDLHRQLVIRNSEVKNMKSLKVEVCNLQKDLLHERTKVKALGEEIQNPVNVHRWRKLEGSDPDSYEMIQKIQTLQKRLIEKTEDVVEKDLIIEDKERLYVQLQNILARQPGPELREQLVAYQQTLKERTRQMKACAAELNMCQARVNEYKYEMERLNRELAETKRKYYEQKKKEQLVRDATRHRTKEVSRERGSRNAHNGTTFVGGGFAL